MSQTIADVEFPPDELARIAGLRYMQDDQPGFTRQMNGKGFVYLNDRGKRLRDKRRISHIETLAIPPAWKEVWISRYANGHLQATGFDDRGRKQYLYHEHWSKISNAAKFWRLKVVPKILPQLRRKVLRDLRGRELSRSRVLAGMVELLDATAIRIGNEEYVRANNSYGLATLRNRHVRIERGKAILSFRAKSGQHRDAEVTDKRLVRLLQQLKKLRGAHVFQYRDDDGKTHEADSIAVNEYLQQQTGHHFTAKDFRTWKGSAIACGVLYEERAVDNEPRRKRVVKRAITTVADVLGNTPTVCRKYYIHSELFDAYLNGKFSESFKRFRPSRSRALSRDEQILSRFLRLS
jgi:DNA topoisomerase-1